MSVPWHPAETNPNPTEGCVCYSANNPDQPKHGGWLNPGREFRDLGHASPHVYICRGCPNLPKDLFDVPEPEVIEGTAEEIVEPTPIEVKARTNLLPPEFLTVLQNQGAGALGKEDV